ncbi:MAG: CHAD domain-containing protein [Planctomycetia bacterium]|nr:CHAD domain-containing protein [Planctomycetia bacterium]
MGRNNKWIESRPDDTVQQVARRALESRLKRTWHYLELAVRFPQDETENVHQLRVFSRRTAAAMNIFGAWLPTRRGDWMRRQVKRIRRAAGEARDYDVLSMRWMSHMERIPAEQSALLLEHIKRHRQEAQHPIETIYKKLVRKGFARRTLGLLERIRQRAGRGACTGRFGCMARVALGQLVVPYLKAAQAEMTDAEALHAFRIQGKQVRYAMEIFAGAFAADLRQQLYPVVATLQERLGAINDHVTAQAHFSQWLAESESGATRQAFELGIHEEQQALEASRREFLDWWTRERREDLHRSFGRYLQLEAADERAPRHDNCGD